MGASEYGSVEGVSNSTKPLFEPMVGGSDGRDLSSWTLGTFCRCPLAVRFLLRAISDSWQSIQKMPCDVRA